MTHTQKHDYSKHFYNKKNTQTRKTGTKQDILEILVKTGFASHRQVKYNKWKGVGAKTNVDINQDRLG